MALASKPFARSPSGIVEYFTLGLRIARTRTLNYELPRFLGTKYSSEVPSVGCPALSESYVVTRGHLSRWGLGRSRVFLMTASDAELRVCRLQGYCRYGPSYKVMRIG